MSSTCPGGDELRAFAIGALSDDRLEGIAQHLEHCSACAESMEALDSYADGFVSGLVRGQGEGASIEIAVPREVMTSAPSATRTSTNINLDAGRKYARLLAEGPCCLGRFQLEAELGDGSFGYVFRARDPDLDRTVAVKIQRAGSLAHGEDTRRFLREAQNAAQLQHPGVVALYETGCTDDDVCFLVTEYVDGDTLADRMARQRFEPRQAAQLIAELAETLQYAHEHGVIHRDIKPSNIILDRQNRPHITDFGLAKRVAADQTVTSDGRVMGTPAYMSPEQARGDSHQVDARSDAYSLGVILYELLTGERPFQGNRRSLLLQLLDEEPRAPRQLDDHIPKDLETICLKAMSKSLQRRYQSAGDLARDLCRYLDGEPIHARPIGYASRLSRWCSQNPIAASLLLAVTLGSCVGFWYLSVLSTYFVEQTALDSAKSEAVMLEGIRDHYSERIIDRLDKNKVRVEMDYRERDDTLPFPAPYLIDAGDYISRGKSGMQVRLYGVHPWRPRPAIDAFQRQALDILKAKLQRGEPDLSYHLFLETDGQRTLRYAKGQVMKESCVKCHNDTAASPKRDWQIGDLVGVLEVKRPLNREIERTRKGLQGAFVLMGSTGTLLAGLSLGLVLATRRRNRRKVFG